MSTFVAIEENQLLFLRNVPLLVICHFYVLCQMQKIAIMALIW